MPRRKKKSNRYWTNITEFAVSSYNRTEHEQVRKERIYRRFIIPAL